MIDKLIKAQEKQVPKYLDKWLKAGRRTKTTDRKKAAKGIHFLYEKILKLPKPKYIIYLDSPMAIELAMNLIKGTRLEGEQLDSQLRSQLHSQLHSQLGSQLYSQLDSQLRSQLDSQLRSQLGSQKLEYFTLNTNLLYWPGWTGFYDFILNELFPKRAKEFKLFSDLCTHWQELHYYILMPELALVSDFPKTLTVNESGQLHSWDGPALEYRDTYSMYRSNGVAVTKEWIETAEWTKDKILSEKNVDVRRETIRRIGISKTIETIGAEVVDTYKSKIGGIYELLMVDYDERGKRPFLKMINPSIGQAHIEGVKPGITTVKDALCFRNGLTTFSEPEVLT